VNEGNLRLFSISIDGCLCLWLFVQGELYPTELITLPFHVDNRQMDSSFSSLNLAGKKNTTTLVLFKPTLFNVKFILKYMFLFRI
jgi:hypothetical protein